MISAPSDHEWIELRSFAVERARCYPPHLGLLVWRDKGTDPSLAQAAPICTLPLLVMWEKYVMFRERVEGDVCALVLASSNQVRLLYLGG